MVCYSVHMQLYPDFFSAYGSSIHNGSLKKTKLDFVRGNTVHEFSKLAKKNRFFWQKSPKEIPYRHCSHCSYKSTKKYNLELHIQNAHTNPKPKRSKTCPKCYKTFTRLCNMKKHQEHCAGKEILIAFWYLILIVMNK